MVVTSRTARVAGVIGRQRVIVNIEVGGAQTEGEARRQPMIVSLLKTAVLQAAEDAGIRLDLEE